jgi:hypothetical protein
MLTGIFVIVGRNSVQISKTYTSCYGGVYKINLLPQADVTVWRGGGNSSLIIDELGFVPLSKTGAELLFEVISQRYERGSIIITSNLPFDEWTEVFGAELLTGAILDRLTHHVNILEMNGESYRLRQSKNSKTQS